MPYQLKPKDKIHKTEATASLNPMMFHCTCEQTLEANPFADILIFRKQGVQNYLRS